MPAYKDSVVTRRTPDLLVPNQWAAEVKIARPFGDNGQIAENWSVNLLHPYPGNTSLIGDCLKLQTYVGPEQRTVIAVGYEHDPPIIDLEPLYSSFELIATNVVGIRLAERVSARRSGLTHPVHQRLSVVGWALP